MTTKKDKQDIISGLNKSGIPFEIGCEYEIKKGSSDHQWEVITKNYPINETEIDLLIKRSTQILRFGIVQCKKTYNKKWVFFRDEMGKNTSEKDFSIALDYINNRSDNYPMQCFLEVSFNDIVKEKEIDICSRGSEIEGKQKAIKETIEKASKQMVRSYKWFFNEVLKQETTKANDLLKEKKKLPPQRRTIFVPLVVTNAPLYVVETSGEDVDITSGNFLKDPQINKVGWLVYKYPLTSDIGQLYATLEFQKSQSYFIVNSSKLTEFLDKIKFTGDSGPYV